MTARQTLLLAAVGSALAVAPALAQTIPQTPNEVARPGGKIPATPKLSLVKVADGFNDPVGVSVADDGSGRIFVVERVGRVKIVGSDGKVMDQPFLSAVKCRPDSSSRGCGRSRSTRSSRKTDTCSCTIHRCRLTALRSSRATRSIRRARTRSPPNRRISR